MRLSDYVIKYIEDLGVEHIFMLTGGAAMYLNDSVRKSKLKYVCNLHEQACGLSACGYAQYTNNLGVCMITIPGSLNTLTAVEAAWLDSIPVLFISGTVKRNDLKTNGLRQRGIQEVDITTIVKPITKYAMTILNPNTIKFHLDLAVYQATHGRKAPIWLNIPLDVQSTEIEESELVGYKEQTLDTYYKDMIEILPMIEKSEKPVLLLGDGARGSNYMELIDKLGFPVLTTWKAMDLLDENHPLYIGRPGIIGQRSANIAQEKADLILSIGARLDYGQTSFNPEYFARNAQKIIVDIDTYEATKNNPSSFYCMDAKDFVSELIEKYTLHKNYDDWIRECQGLKNKYPVCSSVFVMATEYVDNYVFVNTLAILMDANDVLVLSSSGAASEITSQSFKVKKGQRVINMPALGAMGCGLSEAIGVCLASNKQVVCIEGDGSFAMNTQELETIRRLGLPIKIFVLNNQGYASIRNTQNNYFKGELIGCDNSCGVTLPSIKKIASAYGLDYSKIENHNDILGNINMVLNEEGAIICEVMINPKQITQPRVRSSIKDGVMVSDFMENMYPYED